MTSMRKTLFGGFAVAIVAMSALVLFGGGRSNGGGQCGTCPSAFTTAKVEKSCCGGCGGEAKACENAAVVLDAAEGKKLEAAVSETLAPAKCTACKKTGTMCSHCQQKHHQADIKALKTHIEAARAAVTAGESKTALAELDKAHGLVAKLAAYHAPKEAKATAKTGAIINTRCPMMGREIDPANVPENLVREFNGRKVGFCCGGCPAAWDKLSETDKQARLEKAK
jgi:iron-sulfur cluster repair protein YtfE (RIC family)